MAYPQYPPETSSEANAPPIFIVSGGQGAIGCQVVETVLVQFPEHQIPVEIVNRVRSVEELEAAVERAVAKDATIAHTMIDPHLRDALNEIAAKKGVPAFDLIGDLFNHLTAKLSANPIYEAGRYHRLNSDFFERVKAIEYTLAHDDGKNPQGWPEAEIVLVGPSRSGKTPLAMYLGDLSWKVANIPIVAGLEPPEGLSELDNRRVFGLYLEPDHLLSFREQRQNVLGTPSEGAYADPVKVYEEAEEVRRLYKRLGFAIVEVTDRPMESVAEEVIHRLKRRFGNQYEGRPSE